MTTISPTEGEIAARDQVLSVVQDYIQRDERIALPPFNPAHAEGSEFALLWAASEPNPFGGTVGPFRYQFEGEDDLLHLFILRPDREKVRPEEAQAVLTFLLPKLPPGLVWLKPGVFSQHFYFGHDELVARASSP